MAESVSIKPSSVVSRGVGASASGSSAGGDSTIEGLKKKLVSLQKDLKDAIGEQSKAGQAKAKLIQMQIQVTQARLEQLIQQQAQHAIEAKKGEKSNSASAAQANSVEKASNAVLGRNIDAFA